MKNYNKVQVLKIRWNYSKFVGGMHGFGFGCCSTNSRFVVCIMQSISSDQMLSVLGIVLQHLFTFC